jgi:hypothetical protein
MGIGFDWEDVASISTLGASDALGITDGVVGDVVGDVVSGIGDIIDPTTDWRPTGAVSDTASYRYDGGGDRRGQIYAMEQANKAAAQQNQIDRGQGQARGGAMTAGAQLTKLNQAADQASDTLAQQANARAAQAQQIGVLRAAQQGKAPSVAQLQMKQAQDQAVADQYALAAGARGGNMALAARTASGNVGDIQSQIARDTSMLRAQEMAQARGETTAAITDMRGGDVTAAGAAGQIAGIYGQGADVGLGIGAQGIELGAQGQQNQQFYAAQAQSTRDKMLEASIAYDAQQAQNQQQKDATTAAIEAANVAGQTQLTAGLLSGLGELGGTAIASDIRAKKNINSGERETEAFLKSLSEAGDRSAVPRRPAAVDFSGAKPYSYEYREPERFGRGEFVGPMAQDLERTDAGRQAVVAQPDGTKGIDTSRLVMPLASAVGQQQSEIDEMRRRLAMAEQAYTSALGAR